MSRLSPSLRTLLTLGNIIRSLLSAVLYLSIRSTAKEYAISFVKKLRF